MKITRMRSEGTRTSLWAMVLAALLSLLWTEEGMAQAKTTASTSTVASASQNQYMKVLRRHVGSRYAEALASRGLWNMKGRDARSMFWRDEQKRQEALGGLGVEPTQDEIMALMVDLPDGVVYDFMLAIRLADQSLSDYIDKQDRLIGLVDTVSSEIKVMDACERTGKTGMKDYHYLLTIDDGPSPDNQTWILQELESEGVKAIFFLIGEQAEKQMMTPDPYLRMGHDVGMHTSNINFEEDATCILIDPLMDRKWFRAHGGSRDAIYTRRVREVGGLHLLWNVDSRDWEFVGFVGSQDQSRPLEDRVEQAVASSVAISLVRGSGIVLFHETVQLAPEIIGRYIRVMKAIGCEFVTPEAAWEGFGPDPAPELPEHPEGL